MIIEGDQSAMNFIDPPTLGKSWVLTDEDVKNPVEIPVNILKHFGRQDVIALDFLYRSYRKELNGIILNEEEDFNPHLQVSSFLGALYRSVKNKFLVLVLCPDDQLVKWHYYISQCSEFEIKIITETTVPEDFDQDTGIVLILKFSNIKLADFLKEYDFFSVVIDDFDEVATKLAIRRLQGTFNIGITSRNFFVDRDQKLQWTMLNWSNNGCVGKLKDFYEIDNDNFANLRNNYREWWFRITWDFCDTFEKPTLEEKGNLHNTLREWAKTHSLPLNISIKTGKKTFKRKNNDKLDVKEEPIESEITEDKKRKRKVYNKNTRNKKRFQINLHASTSKTSSNVKNEETFRNLDFSSDSSESSKTIIYKNGSVTNLMEVNVSEDDFEPPINALNSDKILEQSQEGCSSNQRKKALETSENPSENDDDDDDVRNEKTLETFQNTSVNPGNSGNDSASSGEDLLCSLVGTNYKKSERVKIDWDLEDPNYDDSDLFLKSVAASKGDSSPLKNREKADRFFDKIFDNSEVKEETNTALTQMELELTEKEVLDVPSESDNFFKGIFSRTNVDESEDNYFAEKDNFSENRSVNCTNDSIDVDSLIAEVKEMVEK